MNHHVTVLKFREWGKEDRKRRRSTTVSVPGHQMRHPLSSEVLLSHRLMRKAGIVVRRPRKAWMVEGMMMSMVMPPATTATTAAKPWKVRQPRKGGWSVKLGQSHGQAHRGLSAWWNDGKHPGHGISSIWRGDALLFSIFNLFQERRVELVQVLWHQVRVHLDMGEALGMALEVNLEVPLRGEPIAADVALVGPLASMGPKNNSR
jgi:hypothetical protein